MRTEFPVLELLNQVSRASSIDRRPGMMLPCLPAAEIPPQPQDGSESVVRVWDMASWQPLD